MTKGLTTRQQEEAHNVLDNTKNQQTYNIVKPAKVQDYINGKQSELSDHLQIKRADVIEGLKEAIDMAKLAADPSSMIRGWSEIAKMLGLYAPEVKKLEISSTSRNMISKYEAMTDEELMGIIEGEFERVTEH